MNKRLLSLMLAALLALSGCSARAEEEGPKRYEASFLTLFDTVTTVVGYAWREEDFGSPPRSSTTSFWSTTGCLTSTTAMRA